MSSTSLTIAEILHTSIQSQIAGKRNYPMLQGPPGIGKTMIVHDYCKDNGYAYVQIILSRYGSYDIGGLWVPDFESQRLKHFSTDRLLEAVTGYPYTVIHLDEFSNTDKGTYPAIQSIFTSREIEGKKVPNNVLFVLSGNGPNDGCNTTQMPIAIRDRIRIHKVGINKEAWIEWAISKKLSPYIIAYHGWSEDSLFKFDPDSDYEDDTPTTPRSWENLDGFMHLGHKSPMFKEIAATTIGREEATRFIMFMNVADNMPTYKEVVENPSSCKFPNDISSNYAVIANISHALLKIEKNNVVLSQKERQSIVTFVCRFSEEWQVMAIRTFERVSPQFLNSIECSEIEIKHNAIWNESRK